MGTGAKFALPNDDPMGYNHSDIDIGDINDE